MGIVVYTSFYKKTYADLYVEYYKEKDLPSLVSRGNTNEVLNEALIAYQSKNYQEALRLFELYNLKSNTIDPLTYSYIGMSYLELEQPKEAVVFFDKLYNSDSFDQSKGLWYKCLVYLKINDNVKLKNTLIKIIENPANYNYNKALELLDDL